jgi:hypothetical protein
LERNASCAAIEEICVLTEGDTGSLAAFKDIRTKLVRTRPTYDDFFRWISELAADHDISIVANTDIWFGDDIAIVEDALGPEECFALARWEPTGLFDRNDSQDCWIFRGKIRDVRGDFPLGVPRCDNRLVYELDRAGYRVRNPSFSVRANHLHARRFQEYHSENLKHFVAPPYGYLWPSNLWSLPKTLAYNSLHPQMRIQWRFDRRSMAHSIPVRIFRKASRLAKAVISRLPHSGE